MAAHPLTACVWFGVTSITQQSEINLSNSLDLEFADSLAVFGAGYEL
jgi:hypothetical protein